MNYICGFIIVVGGFIFADLFSIVVAWFFCDWLDGRKKNKERNA